MRVLITGICGFVGSTIATAMQEQLPGIQITGLDSLVRAGSEINRASLRRRGIGFVHGDIRSASDVEALPAVDWVIDAAANASVLAGVDGQVSSRQLVEHNLLGTVNLLEYCRKHRAGFILLSTSRVYSIPALSRIEVEPIERAFKPRAAQRWPGGVSVSGVGEHCSTEPPISLYGVTKLASETLALEYGAAFSFPVRINRCGVLAGAGQFGRADQGIFSFWIHSYAGRRPLKYIGFGGQGYQVRDCLHPRDLAPLLVKQTGDNSSDVQLPCNVGGGVPNSMSLRQLSDWCAERFGSHEIAADPKPRTFDIPWMVMDSGQAMNRWQFEVKTPLTSILEEIARHAEGNPDWMDRTTA